VKSAQPRSIFDLSGRYRGVTPRAGGWERQAKRSTPPPGRARRHEDVVLGRIRSFQLRIRHCVLASYSPIPPGAGSVRNVRLRWSRRGCQGPHGSCRRTGGAESGPGGHWRRESAASGVRAWRNRLPCRRVFILLRVPVAGYCRRPSLPIPLSMRSREGVKTAPANNQAMIRAVFGPCLAPLPPGLHDRCGRFAAPAAARTTHRTTSALSQLGQRLASTSRPPRPCIPLGIGS
jgi:hypothetical protein